MVKLYHESTSGEKFEVQHLRTVSEVIDSEYEICKDSEVAGEKEAEFTIQTGVNKEKMNDIVFVALYKYYGQPGSESTDGTVSTTGDADVVKSFFDEYKDNIVDLVNLSEFVGYHKLHNDACKAVAKHICNMNTEEMRVYFGIGNDFSKKEYEEAVSRTTWTDERLMQASSLKEFYESVVASGLIVRDAKTDGSV